MTLGLPKPDGHGKPSGRSFGEITDEALLEAEAALAPRERNWSRPLHWDELLRSDRILIVSEAGAGKTHECGSCRRRLWDEGQAAFLIELAELAREKLEDLLSPDEQRRLVLWRSQQSGVATFFLDSVDELKLTQGSFRSALTRLRQAIDGQLARARIVITSRPIPFDRRLVAEILPVGASSAQRPGEDGFADIAMGVVGDDAAAERPAPWRVVELLRLTDVEMMAIASEHGVDDPAALLADIRNRNAAEFAERPQDLIELCNAWRADRRISDHRTQVANDIVVKLKPRGDRRERSALSPDRALEGAGRLALAAMLTRRLTFRHSAESDVTGTRGMALDPAEILRDWSDAELATLLERPLFGFASYGRVRFHHRSVIEFLAAGRLARRIAGGQPMASIKRLLMADTGQGDRVVRPAMRPVAAWLALDNESIFASVCDANPEVLLDHGDPSALTDAQRERALEAYALRYGSGGWHGLHVPAVQVRRFATAALGPLVRRLWATVESPDLRNLLLDLIGAGRIRECADIARCVVMASAESVEARLSALDTLMGLHDPSLEEVARSLELDPVLWPREISRPAVVRLFPAHVRVAGLLSVLARVGEQPNSVSYLNYYLPLRIAETTLAPAEIAALTRGLSDLVGEGISWTHPWPHYASARPFLVPALAAACTRRLAGGPVAPELASSISLALRLSKRDHCSDERIKALKAAVASAGVRCREALFRAEDAFRQTHRSIPNAWERLWASAHEGPIELTLGLDGDWILAALKDRHRPPAERAMMFEAAILLFQPGGGGWRDRVGALNAAVADDAALCSALEERSKPVPVSPARIAVERDRERRLRRQERRRLRDRASWIGFWREVALRPLEAFADGRASVTAWNLWTAMGNAGRESRTSGWDRPFLEAQFGKEVADRTRAALARIWRADRPTLRSERPQSERNAFLVRWQLGLAAIHAEAEDRDWARKLDAEEAAVACRYVPIQLNGFPAWLDDLVQAHPATVDAVLGNELGEELQEIAQAGSGGWLLRGACGASGAVADLLLPRLLRWLDQGGDRHGPEQGDAAAEDRLETVLGAMMGRADPATLRHLAGLASSRLEAGLDAPLARVWLAALIALDPEVGTSALEEAMRSEAPAGNGAAVSWIGKLFNDLQSPRSMPLRRPDFTPGLLLRLVRLAYRHVRVQDDEHHEGAHTPTARDRAQHARNALLSAVLATRGQDGWDAKLQLAREPEFAHMRSRLLTIARERAAQEADGEPMDIAHCLAFERRGEAPPRTRDEMFQVAADRLDDIDDLLLQDVSPREEWAAIRDERVMRRALSRQLRAASNGAYVVDQEAVTADEKETDIRLVSTASPQQCVIELKVGERPRSAADLREALSKQLVSKYMAADDCRAGLLVITVAGPRTWRHPDTEQVLDHVGLIEMLNQDAHRIMADLGMTLRIAARAIDLSPRLPPENRASAGSGPKRKLPRSMSSRTAPV